MSTLSPEEQAAIPTAIAALQAVLAFNANMGADPLQWVAKYPGSQLILIGTLQNLAPSLLVAEGGAVQAQANGLLTGWIGKLQAAQTPAPAA
jgi:hypothetical protein